MSHDKHILRVLRINLLKTFTDIDFVENSDPVPYGIKPEFHYCQHPRIGYIYWPLGMISVSYEEDGRGEYIRLSQTVDGIVCPESAAEVVQGHAVEGHVRIQDNSLHMSITFPIIEESMIHAQLLRARSELWDMVDTCLHSPDIRKLCRNVK